MIRRDFALAVQLYRAATVHRDAAKQLVSLVPVRAQSYLGHEVVYLGGYVVECSLKSMVVSQTLPTKHPELLVEFKSEVKHNLDSLRVRLARRGVQLPTTVAAAFVLVRSIWAVEMRYNPKRRQRSEVERFLQEAEVIYLWANR